MGVGLCTVFGHRFRFSARAETLEWTCARGCGAGGSKTYADADAARRYAAAFDKEDRADLGRRAPLGLLPLRFAARRARGPRR
ncbi:hypothetical protein ACL02T_24805 [Pseudonocardia sp. RS010]|uniref:hypothetical protein n=1 Tax=Pseudonocardia sp. RS010 TaxID=3385979 RepID=UPI0039A31ED4